MQKTKSQIRVPPSTAGIFLFAVILLLTALRSIGLANDWSLAHWLINYDLGFIKRGLTGTMLSPYISWNDKFEGIKLRINTVSLIFTCGLLLVIFFTLKDIYRKNSCSDRSFFFCLLFAMSPFIVQIAHLNGYFDSIVILLSFLSAALIIQERAFLAALTLSFGMFVHENILVIGYPSSICLAYLRFSRSQTKDSQILSTILKFVTSHINLIAIPMAAFLCVAWLHSTTISAHQGTAPQIEHISRLGYFGNHTIENLREGFTVSFTEFFQDQVHKFLGRVFRTPYLIGSLIPLLTLIYLLWDNFGTKNKVENLLVISAALAPLTLLMVAWDHSRIQAFPYASTLIILWGTNKMALGEPALKKISPKLFYFLIVLIALFALNKSRLFENKPDNFPLYVRAGLYFIVIFAAYKLKLLIPAKIRNTDAT